MMPFHYTNPLRYIGLFLLVFSLFSYSPLQAQKNKKDKKGDFSKKDDKPKPINEITKKCIAYDGMFPIYQDSMTGKAYLKVTQNQLDREFIHFSFIEDGVLDAGNFRGAYQSSSIFKPVKYFNKIEFCVQNHNYYFDKNNALHRAAKANINEPIVVSQNIVGINKAKTEFLIEADGIFLTESLQQIKSSPPSDPKNMGKRFSIGKLSRDKSQYVDIKNYPANTDVIVKYVYEKQYPSKYGSDAVTDARYVSIQLRHSLIAVPENDYQPRFDDPRIGYFTTKVTDQTSVSPTPYRDLIHRWHLVKKNPDEALSEPVEPIVWWLENTTPEEIRPIIKDAVESWNFAFEKAGFKNAVVAKIQPDDADWDAGDIRYNVLRWTASPRPPFGGYGPSFVNPRTGQILGADIMLEYVYITNKLQREELFETAATFDFDHLEGTSMKGHEQHQCMAGMMMQQANLFGLNVMKVRDLSEVEKSKFLKESLYRLTLHEVGHTLGLNHNFKGTQLHKYEDVHNEVITKEKGLTNSVMEYPAINIALDREKQGMYYDVKPGLYDHWAVEFGYSPAAKSADKEAGRLENILSRSANPDLIFGNDADALWGPFQGIDPRVMVYDMSSDPISYAVDRIKLVNKTFPSILQKYSEKGESYHHLRNAYLTLSGEYGNALNVISRHIGGIYVDRSMVGQEGAAKPFTPVAYADQKRAMKALTDYGFSTTAFSFPTEVYNYLQIQRRGFNHFGTTEDPKIHDRTLRMQTRLLSFLMHDNVLQRLTDSEMYGNKYSLSEMMTDLTDGIFKADLRTSVNTIRQNLQVEYVNRLANIVKSQKGYDHTSKAMAHYELKRIEQMQKTASAVDISTKAHRAYVLHQIEVAMDED
ncbi:MAG: zinc-dependent metalloprotease [Chitinophagales bacterium]